MGSDPAWQSKMISHLIARGFRFETVKYAPEGFTCWVCEKDRYYERMMFSLVKGEVRLWCCTRHEVDQEVMRLG